MNKQTFLESLPFLQIIPPSTPIQIWKSHRDEIIEYVQSSEEKVGMNDTERKENSSSTKKEDCCLFSHCSHVVSIEPNIHHDGQAGKPAFFQRSKDNKSNGSRNKNGDHKFHYDPALTGFSAFLLPAEIHGDDHRPLSPFHSPAKYNQSHTKQQRHRQQQTSPTFSSASTSMSVTPQQHHHQPQYSGVTGGKFENSNSSNSHDSDGNGNIDERNTDIASSTLLKTYLLYFLFKRDGDNCIYQSQASSSGESCPNAMNGSNGKRKNRGDFDVYFVDYQRVNELEIVLPPSPSVSSMSQNDHTPYRNSKPTSLLIKFDSCNFRVFDRDFLLRHHPQIETINRHGNSHEQQQMGRTGNGDLASRCEQQLRNGLKRIQECIISHNEKSHQLRYFNDNVFLPAQQSSPQILCTSSIYPYLFCMVHPSTNCDTQRARTIGENGQTEEAPATTDEGATSKSNIDRSNTNHTGDESDGNGCSKGSIETPESSEEKMRAQGKDKYKIAMNGKTVEKEMLNGTSTTSINHKEKTNDNIVEGRRRIRKRKYKCYEKSWKSLEKMHKIVTSRANLDGISTHQQFASLLQTSANELRNSYLIDEALPENSTSDTCTSTNIFVSREAESTELDCKMSVLQHSIDESIQRIFPSSSMGGRASLKKKEKDKSTCIITEEHNIENSLKEYRKALAAQHMMAFLPSR